MSENRLIQLLCGGASDRRSQHNCGYCFRNCGCGLQFNTMATAALDCDFPPYKESQCNQKLGHNFKIMENKNRNLPKMVFCGLTEA